MAHWLVDELVERLLPTLPPGWYVVPADDGQSLGVGMSEAPSPVGWAFVAELADQPGDPAANAATAAHNALDIVQDEIAQATHEPWPAPDGAPWLPLAHVEAVGNELRLRFGTAEAPTLELAPILLPWRRS